MSTTTENELRVSEMFTSIQGEGPTAGRACTFLRLAHCNLRCQWCDTRYSWDFERYDYDREVTRRSVEDVARSITEAGERRLVITGGEPLLQQAALATLLRVLPSHVTVEVETNGTVVPCAPLRARVDQWNVSPKLACSGEPRPRRIVPEALAALRGTGRMWLKLVVAPDDDPAEVDALVAEIGLSASRVLLMPEAPTPDVLAERTPALRDLAASRGYGTSPRLHVERFDGKRGC